MNEPNFISDCCPSCLYRVDSASEIDQAAISPVAGDFSICLNCGCLLRYNNDLRLTLAEDSSDLSSEQFAEIQKVQAYIRKRGLIA